MIKILKSNIKSLNVKKEFILLLIILLTITGCNNNANDNEKLEAKLIEYGKSVFESDSFQSDIENETIITMDLTAFEKIGKDISMFLNKSCNKTETKVMLTITYDDDKKPTYIYNTNLSCK